MLRTPGGSPSRTAMSQWLWSVEARSVSEFGLKCPFPLDSELSSAIS